MIPRFQFLRPASLTDAFAAFADTGGDAAWMAGGTELLQVMKMGLAQFGTLIDVKGIADLHGLRADADGALIIGAGTTHRVIERSPIVREHVPALASLAAEVANVRVRNTGTIGGNLAFAEPHSDPATFLLACDTIIHLVGPRGGRALGIGDFILGPLWTAREEDELLVSIRIPVAAKGVGRGYAKFAFFERPAASVAVHLAVEDGIVTLARVAVGSLTDVPTVVPRAGDLLTGRETQPGTLGHGLGGTLDVFDDLDIVADHNGSADYKRHLAGVLLGQAADRALTEAIARA
ncbi:MAG: FAD binding domain-containing protein [Candidatus Limnocylindrales bacterium]